MKRYLIWLFRFIYIGVVVSLCVVNRDAMTLQFYPLPYEITLPKFLFALLIFAFGMLLGYGSAGVKFLGTKVQHKKEKQRSAALENELATLRTEARHARQPVITQQPALPSV